MERLWSPAVATSGNPWQMPRPRKRLQQAKTLAMGCDPLPLNLDGKEGVSGSSPEEGFASCLGLRGDWRHSLTPCASTMRQASCTPKTDRIRRIDRRAEPERLRKGGGLGEGERCLSS